MDKLSEARKIINSVDREMAQLFCQRMDAVKMVAEYKQEHGLPVFDGKREAEVIKNNSLLVEDSELRAYYVNYVKAVMDISKNYQHKLLEGSSVAYCGVEGAFANIAANGIGGRMDELCEITPKKFNKKAYILKDTSDAPIETVKKMSTKEELFEALKKMRREYEPFLAD